MGLTRRFRKSRTRNQRTFSRRRRRLANVDVAARRVRRSRARSLRLFKLGGSRRRLAARDADWLKTQTLDFIFRNYFLDIEYNGIT